MNLLEKKNEHIDVLTKICTLLIVISPVLSQYSGFLPFLLLPELLFLLVLPFCLIKNRNISLSRYKFLIFYMIIIFIISMIDGIFINSFSLLEFFKAYSRFLLYIVVIIVVTNKHFNISFGAKAYTIIAVINSIYLIAQYLLYNLFKIYLPWYIKALPIRTDLYTVKSIEQYFSIHGFRPQGFSTEPATFTYYVISALVIILFYRTPSFKLNKMVTIIIALLYTIALVLSGSGTAIVLLSFCWGYWGINFLKEKKISKLYFKILFISLVVIFVFLIIAQLPYVQNSANRVLSNSDLSSRNLRITRGFIVFNQLPDINRLLGVGYGNNNSYIKEKNLQTPFELGEFGYFNTITYILVGTGIIGLFFYFLVYFDLFIKTKGFFRFKTLLLLIIAFSSVNPLSLSIITEFAFIMNGYNQKKYWKNMGNGIL